MDEVSVKRGRSVKPYAQDVVLIVSSLARQVFSQADRISLTDTNQRK